jgi:hypothetical protein
MNARFTKNQVALAIAAAIGTGAVATVPTVAMAAKTPGKYVAGDFHNHTTCSDGSTSMQRLINGSLDTWSLDWFVQAGHGGNGNRNCLLAEDATLAAPAYPFTGQGPNTTWLNTTPPVVIKGDVNGSGVNRNMWRWQSLQEFQYPLIEYFNSAKNKPLFLGLESQTAGHEHTSMSVLTGQIPVEVETAPLPTTPGYTALGNATALAQWEYCFDKADGDTSRGNQTGSGTGNNWNCAVPGLTDTSAGNPNWSATAQKLIPVGGAGVGNRQHQKTLEALAWMNTFHPDTSYFVPAHLERAGPFSPDGQFGFNIEHLRNFNNVAPRVAFGFETQPGHHGTGQRGEYNIGRNTFPGGAVVDSVGGTTYGGTGVYGAQIGGVWDALLGEGRNWWFFASSDWHSRGSAFPFDDRRTQGDFAPGEYQRNYTMVRNGADKIRPQTLVDGLRTGNTWVTTGQIVDRLAFVACASYPGILKKTNAAVESIARAAAFSNTDTDTAGCATMGEKLKVRPGAEIVVSVVVRDPAGPNFSPYTFANPSLTQIGISQPLNMPVLDHIDLIRGMVTGYKDPSNLAEYAGEWPRNQAWLQADGSTTGLGSVPAAAKNTSTAVIQTWSGGATPTWTTVAGTDGTPYLQMTYRIPPVTASQYVRLRGTNLPPATPWETDASGNPLSDVFTNANANTAHLLKIPCTVVPTGGSQFNGCPTHMATAPAGSPIAGQKAMTNDVSAWADLWVYANPIYVEVAGSFVVQGVQ